MPTAGRRNQHVDAGATKYQNLVDETEARKTGCTKHRILYWQQPREDQIQKLFVWNTPKNIFIEALQKRKSNEKFLCVRFDQTPSQERGHWIPE